MRLSIIVPVYNVKDYLERCVNSIQLQSFKDFELLLVDDGSTDGSGEMCNGFAEKDSRIRVIHKQNSGQSSARNVGIKQAKGEFITFVDSDDWLESEMYQLMFASIEKNNADIVISRLQMVNAPNDVIKIIGYDKELLFDRTEATKEILRDEMIPSFPVNKIFRRELFDGIEFPVGRIFEDTSTIYKVFYKADCVVTIPYIGYNYWQNPNGTCRKKHENIQKQLDRELYNALAFDERYVFAKSNKELEEVVPLCAFKAYQMIRSFIHMLKHKKYSLTDKQSKIVDQIMYSFENSDLNCFTIFERMDLYMYRFSKPLLNAYLSIIPLFHKMKE
jgi:glycosyltransferase involved in cell wall biosynthesis